MGKKWKTSCYESFESSQIFKRYWDCYKKQITEKNPLLKFQLNTERTPYLKNYSKLLLSEKENDPSSNFTYFDIDTFLAYQKGADLKNSEYPKRKENLNLFQSVYERTFYNPQANPDQSFVSKYNANSGKEFADIFTLSSGLDIHISNTHAKLLLINKAFDTKFCKHFLRPEVNNLIFNFSQITLERKSDFQLKELARSAHNFLINFWVRLSNQNTYPKHPLIYESNWPKEFTTFQFNKDSSFLDLAHHLPYERSLYERNSVESFLKEKRRINFELLQNCDQREVSQQRHEQSLKSEHPWKKYPMRSFSSKVGFYVLHQPDIRNQTYEPRSLVFQSAWNLRKHYQNELYLAHPVEADFLDLIARAEIYLNKTLPDLSYYLTHLVQKYQKPSSDVGPPYLNTERNFHNHDCMIRHMELTSRPRHTLFQLEIGSHVSTLNSDFQYRCLFLVPSNKFPKLLIPYVFQEFIPLRDGYHCRAEIGTLPLSLDTIKVTGRLKDKKKCPEDDDELFPDDSDDDDGTPDDSSDSPDDDIDAIDVYSRRLHRYSGSSDSSHGNDPE